MVPDLNVRLSELAKNFGQPPRDPDDYPSGADATKC